MEAPKKMESVPGSPEMLYASANLKDGRVVHFFLNRDTSEVVVDVVDGDYKSGYEIMRKKL